MWMTLIWKVLKDPKLLAIIILSVLLAGTLVTGYWYKQQVVRLESKIVELNTIVTNLTEINKKITQNRDALVKQFEDFKEIDTKYKSLQVRLDALKKACARPVQVVVVKPSAPIEGSKPVETAPGVVVLPERVVTPIPDGQKPEGTKPVETVGGKTEGQTQEYQFGGYSYEEEAKDTYNSIIIWFNGEKDKDS